jgi:ribosome biogenesis protein Nip4
MSVKFTIPADAKQETAGSLSSLTTTEKGSLVGAVNEVNSKLANLVERQNISTSGMGFNGSMKESNGTITLKNGYTPYILHLATDNYSQNNYIHYWGAINKNNGSFFFEHNLTASATILTITILWIKNN